MGLTLCNLAVRGAETQKTQMSQAVVQLRSSDSMMSLLLVFKAMARYGVALHRDLVNGLRVAKYKLA